MAVDIDRFSSLDDLLDRQKQVRERVEELNTEHGATSFPDEAREEWNELNEEFDKLEERIGELKTREERIKQIADDPEKRMEPGKPPQIRPRDRSIWDTEAVRRDADSSAEETRMLVDNAKRAVEQASYPHIERDKDAVREHIEGLFSRVRGRDGEEGSGKAHLAKLILFTGSDLYKRAFGKAIAGRPNTSEEAFALDRALSLTGSAGGFAIPFELDPTILGTSNGTVNPIRSIARVEQISVDEWRGVSSAGITAAYAAEATETTDNAPTLAQPTVSTEKAQAFIPYSIEVGMDWDSLGAEMGRLLQEAKDDLEAAKFTTGSGTNEPFGVITGATNTVNAAAGADAFTLANLYSLVGALPPRYRPRAAFMADLAILNRIRQFETAGGSTSAVWVDGLQADTPGRLLGKPAYENSEMDGDALAGSEFLLYGDFSRYLIVDRVGLTVENIQHLVGANHRPTGQRGIYAYWRNGAKVLDANAFRVLLGTA